MTALAMLLGAAEAGAQEPPDTLRPPPDTTAVARDTLEVAPDSLLQTPIEPDSLDIPVDTFPRFPRIRGSGYGLSVWEWDRAALASTRALTLTELLMEIPGVIGLRGGDYGTPAAAIGFGGSDGRVRVFLDGFEFLPLDGSIPDLSRIGIGALDHVRVERDGGGLRIDLTSLEPLEPEPVSQIQVGTGDLGTNLLRADFANPATLGGALSFSLDRLETQGPALEESGTLSGVSLRYAYRIGRRAGIAAELRRYASDPSIPDFPTGTITRNDWNVRGRLAVTDDLAVDAYFGASSLAGSEDDATTILLDTNRSQAGVRLGYARGPVFAEASGRRIGRGSGLPEWGVDGVAGVDWPGWLTAQARWSRDAWADTATTAWSGRIRTTPRWGLSVFGSMDDGIRGIPYVPEVEAYDRATFVRDSILVNDTTGADPGPEPERPLLSLTDRRTWRIGGEFTWRGFRASGAYLSMTSDSLHPTGLAFDREDRVLAGGDRTGYEVAAGVPIWRGFRADAAYQVWDEEGPYLPESVWEGAVSYRGIFKESGNLEVWGRVGVKGRDPMLLPRVDPEPEEPPAEGEPALLRVPFHQEWYGFLQIRIVTVSIFLRWENVAGKDDNLDFPGRPLPKFRTLYGIRWVLSN